MADRILLPTTSVRPPLSVEHMINICGTDLNTGIRADQERIAVAALGASVGKRICIKPTAER